MTIFLRRSWFASLLVKGAARVSIFACLAALAACGGAFGTRSPQTQPVAAAAPAPKAPRRARSPQEAAERARLLQQFGGVYDDPKIKRYLDQVLVKLAAASEAPPQVYRVTVLNSPTVNAFAMPTGDLYVTRGLLALANDTSELAAVMAHEIGHVVAHHAAKRAEFEKNSELFSEVAARFEGPQKAAEVEARSELSLAGFSREQEFEADRIGVRMIGKAGYDPYGAARFLSSLDRSTALRASLFGQKSGDEKPDLMSAHPTTPERIARATAIARAIGPPGIGTRARDAYLDAIGGMTFGDDPADGFVIGSEFVHPRLGFAFTAPDGFALDNSAQAVLGVADSGAEALRLDSVSVPKDVALTTYLSSGWIAGLQRDSVQSILVNGLQTATAIANGDAWTFRLAAIRFNDDVYRLIFAARTLTPQDDRAFRKSINSFRPLTKQEAAQAHPLSIVVVRAQPGDTVATMAARMVVADRPLDNFLLLNGLQRGDALKIGEAYKIVTN